MSDGYYLKAAYEVLLKSQRPMHYSSIVQVAMHLGLLKPGTAFPEIAMCSLLSRDIRTNDTSRFRKIKEGVFALSDGVASEKDLSDYHLLGKRVPVIMLKLKLIHPVFVIKKSLYLLKTVKEQLGDSTFFTLRSISGSQCVDLSNLEPLRQELVAHFSNLFVVSPTPVILTHEILTASHLLGQQFAGLNLDSVVDLSVLILETAIKVSDGPSLIIEGPLGSKHVRIGN